MNLIESPEGIKSNSSTHLSDVPDVTNVFRSVSPGAPLLMPIFTPGHKPQAVKAEKISAVPVVSTMPVSIPRSPIPSNVPPAPGGQFKRRPGYCYPFSDQRIH
ncbi:MAG: hypothetical protein KL787_00020 [Taibaiella sp.]|nr:hypothetical protein [Taibaiella sp.]